MSGGSARVSYNVTKSDSAQPKPFQGLYIGGAGDVVIKDMEGTQSTYTAVPAGTILPVCGTHVMNATGASNITAMVRT